ncbi:MAG: hypothetical protein LBN10_10870 [Propionibacteriaceae bacterium]|nr:hypothetical protein [Propionibacteriaceae bacterium]
MFKSRNPAITLVVALAMIGGAIGIGALSVARADGNELQRLSDADVIATMDKAALAHDETLAGQAVDELINRWETADRNVLLKVATDSSYTMETRSIMIDMLVGDGAQLTDAERAMLVDTDFEPELKARILATATFSADDADLLADFAVRSDIVGFQAFKKLTEIDATRAEMLAHQVLADPQKASDLQISAALKSLVRTGSLNRDAAARSEFVLLAVGIAQDRAASSEVRDAAVFALAELREIDAITALIGARIEDPVMMAGAIDQNYDVLAKSLVGKPTAAQVATVVTAMELHPVKDLAEPLRQARTTLTDTALQNRLDRVLQLMETEGVDGNIKWTEN